MKFFVRIFSIVFFSIPCLAGAFLDGDMGIDMYDKIDKWLAKMESQNYQYELTGQGKSSIEAEVNRMFELEWVRPCMWALTVQDIKKVKSGDIEALRKVLSEECFWENAQSMSSEEVTNYISTLKKIDDSVIAKSKDKTRQTYELSRIGLYSDGSKENSPFDLVEDIKEIEKIIFCEESKYTGTPLPNTNNRFNDLIRWVLRYIPENPFISDPGSFTWTETWTGYQRIITREVITPITYSGTYISPYACSTDINTGTGSSWLDKTIVNELLYGSGTNFTWSYTGGIVSWTGRTFSWVTNNNPKRLNPWAYTRPNDNKLWDCNEFFCIKIEFRIKKQNLLGWGKSTNCIASILEKNEKHLKKYAGTSLIQSKKTKNNWELWLLNLSLPDMFSIGTQVFRRPAPILNLEKDDKKKDDNEITTKNLLEERYKNLGLDYKRKNDLHKEKQKEGEEKAFNNCPELSNQECAEKVLARQREALKAGFSPQKNSYISKAITEKWTYEDSDGYFKQFTNLEKFWVSLRDFVSNASGIIRKMNEIPQNK
jgi:hypothetical protein